MVGDSIWLEVCLSASLRTKGSHKNKNSSVHYNSLHMHIKFNSNVFLFTLCIIFRKLIKYHIGLIRF